MRISIHLIMIFLVCLISCKKSEELKIQENNKPGELFNISQIPEIKKMERFVATFENYERKTKVVQTPNLKDIFVTISFPFSFNIVESYVSKGKYVKKGEKLFLIHSDELIEAYRNYLKTNDEELKEKLVSLGFDLKTEPSKEILIVSPDEGVVVFVGGEKKEDTLVMQNVIAIIQKKGELIFNLLLPKEALSDETYYYALLGEKSLPMSVVSSEQVGNGIKLTLSLKGFNPDDKLQNMEIQVVNILQNIFKIPKSAILQLGNENYCFVETSQDIVEKRRIEGFIDGDFFIVTSGIRQTEKIIDNAEKIRKILKIK